MKKILIFGNSGSGKSTLAKELCASEGLAHLDLDTLAWLPTTVPTRMLLSESQVAIEEFIKTNEGWVIEGCYTDLLEIAASSANEVIYMNLCVESCIENARNRPWEPHKYRSKLAQDENLSMLIAWIGCYPTRNDVCSEAAHTCFYETFTGPKRVISSNDW